MRDIRKPVVYVLLIAALLNGVAALALHKKSLADAYHTATSRRPEQFTELYFADGKALPKRLTPGETTAFTFSIGNHEAQDVTYHYRIVLEEPGLQVVQPVHTVHVRAGEVSAVQAVIPAQAAGKRIRVVVQLLHKDQTIAFWAEAA